MNSNEVVAIEEHLESSESMASEESETNKLFVGDHSELPLDTRRTLMQLLSGPFISSRKNSKLWIALCRDEAIIRSRLSELFLDVVIDWDQQVAFVKQAEVDNIEVPTLLRRSPLTFIESALILHLRRCLSKAEAVGERAVISTPEMLEYLNIFEKASSTDRAGFVKKVNSAISKLKANNILQLIRATKDRFEISPTLKILFSTAEISALTKLYLDMTNSDATSIAKVSKVIAESTSDDDEESEDG